MTAQSNITPESIVSDLRYLQLLSRSFPTIADASTEIINLEAILNLPKGTEHFLTDIHGEYEAFQHGYALWRFPHLPMGRCSSGSFKSGT